MHVCLCDSIVQNRKSAYHAWPQRKPAREKLTRIAAGCRLRDVTRGNLSTSGVAAMSATPSTDDIFDTDTAVDDSIREWLQRAQHPGEGPKSRSRSPSVDSSVSLVDALLVSWSLAEEQRAVRKLRRRLRDASETPLADSGAPLFPHPPTPALPTRRWPPAASWSRGGTPGAATTRVRSSPLQSSRTLPPVSILGTFPHRRGCCV